MLKSTSDAVIEKLRAVLENNFLQSCPDERSNSPKVSDDKKFRDIGEPQIEHLSRSIVSKCQISGLDYVIFVKGSGPHAIDYGYEEGKPPKEVLVSRKCAEAVLRGAQVNDLCGNYVCIHSFCFFWGVEGGGSYFSQEYPWIINISY